METISVRAGDRSSDPSGVSTEDWITHEALGKEASRIAAIPGVRQALLAYQREVAAGGAVLDGRDIGTCIYPEADIKIFVTATPEARAMRRYKELQNAGFQGIYEQVLASVLARDAQDMQRDVAPLRPAPGALYLDSTALTPAAMQAWAVAEIERILRGSMAPP
jgi:cytidylate kinase